MLVLEEAPGRRQPAALLKVGLATIWATAMHGRGRALHMLSRGSRSSAAAYSLPRPLPYAVCVPSYITSQAPSLHLRAQVLISTKNFNITH